MIFFSSVVALPPPSPPPYPWAPLIARRWRGLSPIPRAASLARWHWAMSSRIVACHGEIKRAEKKMANPCRGQLFYSCMGFWMTWYEANWAGTREGVRVKKQRFPSLSLSRFFAISRDRAAYPVFQIHLSTSRPLDTTGSSLTRMGEEEEAKKTTAAAEEHRPRKPLHTSTYIYTTPHGRYCEQRDRRWKSFLRLDAKQNSKAIKELPVQKSFAGRASLGSLTVRREIEVLRELGCRPINLPSYPAGDCIYYFSIVPSNSARLAV